MSTLEIIMLIMAVFNALVLPWAIWVTRTINQLDKELSLNSQRDGEITKLIDTVNTRLGNIDTHLNAILIALAKKGIDVDNPNKQ